MTTTVPCWGCPFALLPVPVFIFSSFRGVDLLFCSQEIRNQRGLLADGVVAPGAEVQVTRDGAGSASPHRTELLVRDDAALLHDGLDVVVVDVGGREQRPLWGKPSRRKPKSFSTKNVFKLTRHRTRYSLWTPKWKIVLLQSYVNTVIGINVIRLDSSVLGNSNFHPF